MSVSKGVTVLLTYEAAESIKIFPSFFSKTMQMLIQMKIYKKACFVFRYIFQFKFTYLIE
jgi:hypothetical protein